MQIRLLYSLSHFECDDHTVHMLTQWRLLPPLKSTVKSSLFTHVHSVHSPWLLGYINVMQTVLVILTMAGLFPDRPHTQIDTMGSCLYTSPCQSFTIINLLNSQCWACEVESQYLGVVKDLLSRVTPALTEVVQGLLAFCRAWQFTIVKAALSSPSNV